MSETNKQIQAEQAFYLKEQIIKVKTGMNRGFFILGQLLKKMRDEKLHRLLGCNTMTEFIAQPELAFSRSSVYDYIHVYETYEVKLMLTPEEIADIPYSKLRQILPVVLSDPEEWLSKARSLSRSDLIAEVKKESETMKPARPEEKWKPSGDAKREYLNLISQVEACPVCGKTGGSVDGHHFPRTHARGGKEDDWKRIPLCRECHTKSHTGGKDWLWENRVRVFDFYYGMIVWLIEQRADETD